MLVAESTGRILHGRECFPPRVRAFGRHRQMDPGVALEDDLVVGKGRLPQLVKADLKIQVLRDDIGSTAILMGRVRNPVNEGIQLRAAVSAVHLEGPIPQESPRGFQQRLTQPDEVRILLRARSVVQVVPEGR